MCWLSPGRASGRSLSLRQSQDRVEINFDNFNRAGQIRDDEDLNASWAEIIRLRNYECDPVRWAAWVESGIYRPGQLWAGCHVSSPAALWARVKPFCGR